MYEAAPTLVFAVIGQARAEGSIRVGSLPVCARSDAAVMIRSVLCVLSSGRTEVRNRRANN